MNTLIIAIPIAYLIGSIPFGLIIARAHGIDIRQHGSRNIGATNVRRVLGNAPGNLCLALDMLKGTLPVLAAGLAHGLIGGLANTNTATSHATATNALWLAVAVAAIAGHIFPIYLRFKGGKGVATGFGAIAALWPIGTIAALTALAAWLITVKATRYVSLASCLAAVTLPLAAAAAAAIGPHATPAAPSLQHAWPMILGFVAVATLVLIKHRANLARLRAGTEPKSNQRIAPSTTPPAPPPPTQN